MEQASTSTRDITTLSCIQTLESIVPLCSHLASMNIFAYPWAFATALTFSKNMMADLEFVRAYINDVAVLSTSSWEDHLKKVDKVLTRLEDAGLKVNGLKSFFGRKEFEYLGYILTPNGVKPLEKKVQAMLDIAPPKNVKQLRSFLGIVNYYRDMWMHRSHILAPLNALNQKETKWRWGEVKQRAFDNMKQVIAKETLLHYPDFSKPFEIHTDASKYQIGAVITQDNKPITFYSRKLRGGQHNYTTTERELLAIVETLKEFRTILLGHKIKVYTDHKNLVFTTFNTERVLDGEWFWKNTARNLSTSKVAIT